MRRGYIRLSVTGPDLETQQDALRSAGITDFSDHGAVYVDAAPKQRSKEKPELPAREALMRSCRPGADDEVAVAEEGILGLDPDDTLRVMAILAERSATLFVVASGKSYRWHPDAAEAIDLVREGEHQRAKWRAAHARKKAPPRKKVLRAAEKAKAKLAWFDHTKSGEEVAREFGVGHRTLYNTFGPRGAPLFGGQKGRRK